MPYDPRDQKDGFTTIAHVPMLISPNHGLGEPPKGKFRVIGVASLNWIAGDFTSEEEAILQARSRSSEMTKMYVYDDTGKLIGDFGTNA